MSNLKSLTNIAKAIAEEMSQPENSKYAHSRVSNNNLIAEFMGYKYSEDNAVMTTMNLSGWIEIMPIESMKYHTEWNWLMPVVDKIESLRNSDGDAYRFTIDMCNVDIENTNINITGTHKIKAVYRAIVEFIKYGEN